MYRTAKDHYVRFIAKAVDPEKQRIVLESHK
jgi:hypothetical protein